MIRPKKAQVHGTSISDKNRPQKCGFSLCFFASTFVSNSDSLDWMELTEKEIIERTLNSPKLKNGSILLFHSDAKHTAAALDIIIRGLKAKGYEIVPVSELIYREGYEIDHTGRQKLKT